METKFGNSVSVNRSGVEDRLHKDILGALGNDDLLDNVYSFEVSLDHDVLLQTAKSLGSEFVLRGGTDQFLVVETTLTRVWELASLEGVNFVEFWGSAEIPRLSDDFLEEIKEDVLEEEIDPAMARAFMGALLESELDETDWHEKFTAEEIVDVDGRPCPLLAGLRRLAKPFILAERAVINHCGVVQKEVRRTLKRWTADENGNAVIAGAEEVVGHDSFPYASVTFEVQLKDGRTFVDSADAWLGNCDKLGHYPTAVATARAEGRVLRKILGIKEHVAEELSTKDAIEELTNPDDNPIAPEQKKLIERLVSQIEGASLKEVFEKVSARDVTGLDELTGAEATAAIKLLNGMKKQKKK